MTIQTVHQSFEEAAKRAKLSTALICGGRSTSYGELSQISNCFASILERHGAGPGALVGLSGERSIDLVVGLLAILKTGAAYVPLDLGYPPDWISHMLKHAGVRLLVNTHRNSPATQFERIEHIGLAIEALDLTKSPDAIHSCVTTEDPAAVIYTSGTAGIPKGVVIPHRAIVTRKDEFREYLAESSTSLWRSSICVVGHISNLLLPLMAGKKIVIATEAITHSPRSLAEAIRRNSISRIALLPSQFRALLDCREFLRLNTLRTIVLSGEAVTPALFGLSRSRMPGVTIVNAYGATETTGLVSLAKITNPDRVIIGSSGLGAKMSVRDSELIEVPAGTPGELCISGQQLASGYLHDTQLTNERFVPIRSGDACGRMYRTGDIARCAHDGTLEILGRMDQLVKIRGFCVNLAMVEAVLEAHQNVERAVVVLENGSPRAYVRATGAISEIQSYLNERLPPFMVPRTFRVVADFPLLPNGKTDRVTVGNYFRLKYASFEDANSAARPSEAAVAAIWGEVFGIHSVTVSDNFFDLGGDSLHSMQILSRIGARYDIDLTPEQLFDNPTVSALADLIDDAASKIH